MKAFWEIQEINNLTERRCSRLKQSGSSLELFFPFEHKVSPRNDEQCLSMCLSMCRWKFSIKKKEERKKKRNGKLCCSATYKHALSLTVPPTSP